MIKRTELVSDNTIGALVNLYPLDVGGDRCMYSASLFIVIKRLRIRADAEDKANKMALSG